MADTLLTLLTEIREGKIVLPDIQRSFIWNKEQIYELYDSLLRGYPVGSFLFWKAIGPDDPENSILYHRFIQEYEPAMKLPTQAELKAGESKMLVLDGQQRLQSLYLGIEGVYEGRELYLDLLSEIQGDEDNGTRYFVRFLNSAELDQLSRCDPGRRMIRLKDFIRLPPDRFRMFRTRTVADKFKLTPGTREYDTAWDILE
jgi:uncharacterized protein with ParB-like and HNH nuclease domain